MILNLLLRWVVTGLFALSAAECGLAVLITRRPWTFVVSHGLHFVMAVAMVAMAWPWGARLPPTGPAVLFLLAAVWFVAMGVVAARTTGPQMVYGYHGLMMLATAWMYAIMDRRLLPVGPGMDMATMSMPPNSMPPTWFGAVNWFGTLCFGAAAVFWASRYLTKRQQDVTRSGSLRSLSQAAMAAGMAVLFLATLFRL